MNIQAMMKQAKALQNDMMKMKDEIDKMEFVGTSSLVKITVNGEKRVLKVEINKDNELCADDIEMLEDMITIAINDAIKQVDDITEKKMGKFGNSIPGLF